MTSLADLISKFEANQASVVDTKISTKLDKSGGTVSGGLTFSIGGAIARDTNTGNLTVSGGSSSNAGAYLHLYGNASESNTGCFILAARDENNTKYLKAWPNGDIKWDGNVMLTTSNGLALSGGTMTGPIKSSFATNTYLNGNHGNALVSSTASGGSYVTLLRYPSQNGVFSLSGYQNHVSLYYTANTTIDAGTNTYTKSVKLLDENGAMFSSAHVTSTWKSGSSGYRVWSDGFIEQWGKATSSGRATTTVTLHKAMTNTNYNITISQAAASDTWSTNANTVTTTSFVLSNNYGPGSWWYVCGF